MYLVGFIVRIYHDARPPKRQVPDLVTVHIRILVINQSDAQNLLIIMLLYASTCFEHYVLIIRRSKFYDTASGVITPVGGRPVHRLRDRVFKYT